MAIKGKSNARRSVFPQNEVPIHTGEGASEYSPKALKPVDIKARTSGQRFYIKELLHGGATFVIAAGPAGTGKTFLAVLYAIQELRAGNIKKVVISRPNVGAGDDLGFLPGDIDSKMLPWIQPIIDVFHEYYSPYQVDRMIKDKVIEVAPLVYIRGRTFKKSLVILDEAQNTTPDQMLAFLTRVGEGSRYIITGDTNQHDQKAGRSGLADLLAKFDMRFEDSDDDEAVAGSHFSVFKFGLRDVVRHPAVVEVLELYA